MTANAGYHAYNTGDVLTAAQVQFNLQNQTVMYFATTVARDAALTGAILIEGLVSYVPSTKMMYYNGSAWVAVGAALPLTTTGDTLYSSPGATAVRLGIGSTGQVLTVAAGVPSWATAAAGPRVIQVINVAYSTNTASSTSTYIDTGLTATITPTSASNKILVIVSQAGVYNSGAATSVNLKLVRDATDRLVFATRGAYGSTADPRGGDSCSCSYLDSPATTSPTTYKTQFNSGNNIASVLVQNSNANSTITLIEVTP